MTRGDDFECEGHRSYQRRTPQPRKQATYMRFHGILSGKAKSTSFGQFKPEINLKKI